MVSFDIYRCSPRCTSSRIGLWRCGLALLSQCELVATRGPDLARECKQSDLQVCKKYPPGLPRRFFGIALARALGPIARGFVVLTE